MDVILFCGQSNMQGQSDRLSDSGIVENAYEYKWLSDKIVPLCDPVGENISYSLEAGDEADEHTVASYWLAKHVTGSSCFGHTTLVPSFCRTYTALTGREILSLHIAKGSTTVDQWLPGSEGYAMILRKTLAALKKVSAEHVYLVWLQGESDAIYQKTCEEYKKSLRALCSALKKDVGLERFGIIRVGRFTGDERDDEIICAQVDICATDPDFIMLTDISEELYKSPEHMCPNIPGHFSAKGLEALGRAAAETLAELS